MLFFLIFFFLSFFISTPAWTAPEVLRGEKYSASADVYSFGVIVWEMTTQRLPYEKWTPLQIAANALAENGQFLVVPEDADDALKNIMKRTMEVDARLRPSFKDLLQLLEE